MAETVWTVHPASEQEIRLQCLREALKHTGNMDTAIEAAKKAAAFILSNDSPESPDSSQRRD